MSLIEPATSYPTASLTTARLSFIFGVKVLLFLGGFVKEVKDLKLSGQTILQEKFKMDNTCVFCQELCLMVYYRSDLAHLCLSCDRHVHNAIALSHRHLQTLLSDG